MNTTTSPAEALIQANLDTKTTDELLVMHGQVEAPRMSHDDRLIAAMIADTITNRLNLGPALDAIYDDVDYEGTYHEAILKAMGA